VNAVYYDTPYSMATCLNFVTYNMHGYNQGFYYLQQQQLCSSADVQFVQEHWLPPCGLSRLQNVSDDCFCSSAMNNVIYRSILSGRPFGGVAILVRSTLAKHCRLLCKADRLIILS